MFNLKHHNVNHEAADQLLESELVSFDIFRSPSGNYRIEIGDETISAESAEECIQFIQEGLQELKSSVWQKWQDLENLADLIAQNDSGNTGSVDNLIFLHSVRRSYLLASLFSELDNIRNSIKQLFYVDVSSVNDSLISQFNQTYLMCKLIHRLIMQELYRIKLLRRYQCLHKSAGVAGPWSNLEVPIEERAWAWEDGEEEYFSGRQKQRREQVRYNPEYNSDGFYFVWQDLSRDPYKFEDMSKDSPYKSRLLLSVP